MGQKIVETLVRFLRAPQTRKHSHGPEPSSIHGRVNPAREGRDARETNVPGIADVSYIFRSVKPFDFKIGDSAESREAFRGFAKSLCQILCIPFLFLLDLSKLVLSEHVSPPLIRVRDP
jgi:hypothetical protein